MFGAEMPPAVLKLPPATTSPLGREASAYTMLFVPEPSADQAVPFQLAILLAARPPARVNAPAATSSPLGNVVKA
jgi:hypothetical protein